MISLQTLFAFTLLNMSFALIPGPDVMCILGNAITPGARARGWFLARQRAFQRFQQGAGTVLIGLGLRVALERGK
jgi:threonine/homoserine/homoserine lactone efflux protein